MSDGSERVVVTGGQLGDFVFEDGKTINVEDSSIDRDFLRKCYKEYMDKECAFATFLEKNKKKIDQKVTKVSVVVEKGQPLITLTLEDDTTATIDPSNPRYSGKSDYYSWNFVGEYLYLLAYANFSDSGYLVGNLLSSDPFLIAAIKSRLTQSAYAYESFNNSAACEVEIWEYAHPHITYTYYIIFKRDENGVVSLFYRESEDD